MPREPSRVRVDLGPLALEVLDWPGSLPPVLALHGLAGNAREWDRMARAFDDLRVLAVDLRGHGSSDWADSYAVDAYVHDVEDVVERVHSGPVVVVGHSLGGIVGMTLGARRPDLVERLVVVDIGPEVPASAVAQMVARRDRPTAFDGPETAFDALRAANPFAPDDVIRDRVAHGFVESSPGSGTWRHDPLVQVLQAGALDGLWETWRASTSPALVVRGEHSPYLTSELMRRMVAARPHASGVTIRGAGHNAHTDRPDAFHTAIEDRLGTGATEDAPPANAGVAERRFRSLRSSP
jgi:esterase